MKNILSKRLLVLLAFTAFLLLFMSCNPDMTNNTKNPQMRDSSDFIYTTPGHSVRYAVSYPESIEGNAKDTPAVIDMTFQSMMSTATYRRFFISSPDDLMSVFYIQENGSGLSYGGGAYFSNVAGTLVQKLILPETVPVSGSMDFTVKADQTFWGPGLYKIEALDTYTVSGVTYHDCLKVIFPNSKINLSGQTGEGFYILAEDIGIIYYEAELTSTAWLGATGETIIYTATGVNELPARHFSLRIVDADDAPIPNAFIDFSGGYGPVIQADAVGQISDSIYLPNGHPLEFVDVYTTISNARGEYVRTYEVSTPVSGDISLGDLEWAFSKVTVTLDPPNGATDVTPGNYTLRATFSIPMMSGYAFIRFDEETFPPGTAGPVWSGGNTVIEFPRSLPGGKTFRLGLNSPRYTGFTDTAGRPLEQIVWEFSTAAE